VTLDTGLHAVDWNVLSAVVSHLSLWLI